MIFFEETLAEDIRAIYKMGYFEDVKADVEDTSGRQSHRLYPPGKIPGFGNCNPGQQSQVSTSDIEGVVTIKVRQTLNTEKAPGRLWKRVRALYDSKGYYDAEVQDVIEKDGEKGRPSCHFPDRREQ